jgi:hypothetical protein
MPTLQSSYLGEMPALYEGFTYDSKPHGTRSMMVEPSGGIGFGKAVFQGTRDDQGKLGAASAKFVGVAEATKTQAAATPDIYPQYAEMNVRYSGPIAVLASVNVAAGDAAFVVPATGVFTNVATDNTRVGVFESTAASGALVKLRLG